MSTSDTKSMERDKEGKDILTEGEMSSPPLLHSSVSKMPTSDIKRMERDKEGKDTLTKRETSSRQPLYMEGSNLRSYHPLDNYGSKNTVQRNPFGPQQTLLAMMMTERLATACRYGCVDEVKTLIERGADCNAADRNGNTPLTAACRTENLEIIKTLIEHGADCNAEDENGYMPLTAACRTGNVEIIKTLIEHGADCNASGKNGDTPLTAACSTGNVEIVKTLIEHGADCNAAGRNGSRPLTAACRTGNVEICKTLIEHGADCNAADKHGYTPLTAACRNGNVEISKTLIEHGADCNAADKHGYTPLTAACRNGTLEIVKTLIEHSADCNAADNYGYTPLTAACTSGKAEIVKTLIEHGADCNAANRNGYTPLIEACRTGNEEIVKTLIECGANCNNAADMYSTILLLAACKIENVEFVKTLIKHGVDCNAGDKYGNTPLTEAFRTGNVEIVKTLVEHGAQCNTSKYGITPLTSACTTGNAEIVKILIEHGADCNAADRYGYTPLTAACRNGNVEIVKTLIEHGADCNAADRNGNTPRTAACISGNVEIKTLIENGADCYAIKKDTVALKLNEKGNITESEKLPPPGTKTDIFEDAMTLQINEQSNITDSEKRPPSGDKAEGSHDKGDKSEMDSHTEDSGFPKPVFSEAWQFVETFSSTGGHLRGADSDVILWIPPNAISGSFNQQAVHTSSNRADQQDEDSAFDDAASQNVAGVAISGAICTDLQTVHEQLQLAEDERICSPVAEYFAGTGFRFQKCVCICLPHFLPDGVDETEIKVYRMQLDTNGTTQLSTLVSGSNTNGDNVQDEGYYLVDEREIKVFTSHFSGYFCTNCESHLSPPRLGLRLYGTHVQRGKSQEVDLKLRIWDLRLGIRDFRKVAIPDPRDENTFIAEDTVDPVAADLVDKVDFGVSIDVATKYDDVWMHEMDRNDCERFPPQERVNLNERLFPCCFNLTPVCISWSLTAQEGSTEMWFVGFVNAGYILKTSASFDFLHHPRKRTLKACLKFMDEQTSTGTQTELALLTNTHVKQFLWSDPSASKSTPNACSFADEPSMYDPDLQSLQVPSSPQEEPSRTQSHRRPAYNQQLPQTMHLPQCTTGASQDTLHSAYSSSAAVATGRNNACDTSSAPQFENESEETVGKEVHCQLAPTLVQAEHALQSLERMTLQNTPRQPSASLSQTENNHQAASNPQELERHQSQVAALQSVANSLVTSMSQTMAATNNAAVDHKGAATYNFINVNHIVNSGNTNVVDKSHSTINTEKMGEAVCIGNTNYKPQYDGALNGQMLEGGNTSDEHRPMLQHTQDQGHPPRQVHLLVGQQQQNQASDDLDERYRLPPPLASETRHRQRQAHSSSHSDPAPQPQGQEQEESSQFVESQERFQQWPDQDRLQNGRRDGEGLQDPSLQSSSPNLTSSVENHSAQTQSTTRKKKKKKKKRCQQLPDQDRLQNDRRNGEGLQDPSLQSSSPSFITRVGDRDEEGAVSNNGIPFRIPQQAEDEGMGCSREVW